MMKANEIKVKMDAAYEKWQKRIAITKKNEEKAEKALATIKRAERKNPKLKLYTTVGSKSTIRLL